MTKVVWVVVTAINIGDQDLVTDVVLVTPDKKKAERCTAVLAKCKHKDATSLDAKFVKKLAAFEGAIPGDALVPYDTAGCFQRDMEV